MRSSAYTLLYSAILAVVIALLLTGAGRITAPYWEANVRADEVRNILEVLEVPFDPKTSSQQLVEIFQKNVRRQTRGDMTVYAYVPPGQDAPQTVAFPLEGPGVWGKIHGFLSMAGDLRTIRAIAFHRHEETPGLGGEISATWFRRQFVGKSIVGPSGPGMHIRRSAKGPNEVDAISGATLTCDKVELILNHTIEKILQEHPDVGQ